VVPKKVIGVIAREELELEDPPDVAWSYIEGVVVPTRVTAAHITLHTLLLNTTLVFDVRLALRSGSSLLVQLHRCAICACCKI
jgi:hypothetical protein